MVAGTNSTVSGTGSPANPFVISSQVQCTAVRPCLSAGTGITYNPTTGVISANFSEVPCSVVRPCLSAGDGAAYDPATGVITAHLSGQGGNNLSIGPDGGLFVPTGAATISVGCGLVGNGAMANPVTPAVSAWPWPCSIDTHAGGVYCDSNGNLRSELPPRLTYVETSTTTMFNNAPVPTPTTGQVVHTDNLDMINPDPCRDALVLYEAEVDVDWDLPVGGAAAAGISTDEMQYFINRGSVQINDVHWQMTKVQKRSIPAGGTLTEPINVTMSRGSAGASYNRIQTQQRAWIFNI